MVHQVVEWVWLKFFFEFPLLAICCLGNMEAAAAVVLSQWLVEHLESIQPNPFHDLMPQTVIPSLNFL